MPRIFSKARTSWVLSFVYAQGIQRFVTASTSHYPNNGLKSAMKTAVKVALNLSFIYLECDNFQYGHTTTSESPRENFIKLLMSRPFLKPRILETLGMLLACTILQSFLCDSNTQPGLKTITIDDFLLPGLTVTAIQVGRILRQAI